MANFLSKLFGTKSDRDLKEVRPYLDATLKVYPEIQKLDNDQLRAKTIEFKERIHKVVENEENELATLRARIEEEYDMPIDEKEEIYKRIDKLEKEVLDAKYKALSCSSTLTEKCRESKVLEALKQNKDSLLHVADQPPYIINVPE